MHQVIQLSNHQLKKKTKQETTSAWYFSVHLIGLHKKISSTHFQYCIQIQFNFFYWDTRRKKMNALGSDQLPCYCYWRMLQDWSFANIILGVNMFPIAEASHYLRRKEITPCNCFFIPTHKLWHNFNRDFLESGSHWSSFRASNCPGWIRYLLAFGS